MPSPAWTIEECAYEDVRALADELAISPVTASVLVRRGYGRADQARAFLDADAAHDPWLLGDMAAAVDLLRTTIAHGGRICVHGDYDVDGISATALAVGVLKEIGADVAWHLPSRFDEGYGLSADTVERLAGEGVALLLTVDCGITAVEEVALARELGLEVIVTDHHRPGPTLPDCPLVTTRPSAYPFPELCGTGVVHKLAQALLGPDHPAVARGLDLVALATIADVVPLVDENRALATAGLRALARTGRPGLQALMRSAAVDPAAVDCASVGFRLAPRINAAGRLGRPDVAMELMLSEDASQAARLAAELEGLNRERQAVEERMLREAVALVASWPESQRRRRAYVLAAEDWHEGVIGIVASRLVERYGRPIVMIAGADGAWRGSGRSIPPFDLHGALGACADHLQRFGGHRAAAGLSIHPDDVPAFAEAFAAYAAEMLSDDDLAPTTRVDAVVPAHALTLDLAQELERLAPFGLGNPDVTLLVASCETAEPTTVGDGKHVRFRVRQHGRDAASAIGFGLGGEVDRLRRDVRFDVVGRLKENRWNGSVAPQLVVRRLFEASDGYDELRARLAAEWRAGPRAWTPEAQAIFDELGLTGADRDGPAGASRRELLESPTFRSLLHDRTALLRAA